MNVAYLGQAIIRQAMQDSLVRQSQELTVARVVATPATMYLEVDQSGRLDSTNVTILNKRGRKAIGRRAAFGIADPSIASVDGTGIVKGLVPGTTAVTVWSWNFADTVNITVGDRPANWGPPVTAHDSLATGAW